MMNSNTLKNVVKFLERVQATGLEAYAWCEAHAQLNEEIKRLESLPPVPATNPVPVSLEPPK